MRFDFLLPLNVSIQETDILYGVNLTNDQAGVNSPTGLENKPNIIGKVVLVPVGGQSITVDITGYETFANTVTSSFFLFFSKDRRINTSGITGYYSLAEFRNNSNKEAEIFATATGYSPSSK